MDLTETFDLPDLAQIDDYLKRQQEEHLKTIKGANLASADDRRSFAINYLDALAIADREPAADHSAA